MLSRGLVIAGDCLLDGIVAIIIVRSSKHELPKERPPHLVSSEVRMSLVKKTLASYKSLHAKSSKNPIPSIQPVQAEV